MGSSLLLDEHFEAGDDRFLDELLGFDGEKRLKLWAEKLYADKRPWARKIVLSYIDDGCDRDHHRPFVKKLFKNAESAGDDEVMGHFVVAFDRIHRRELKEVAYWEWGTGERRTKLVLKPVPLDLKRPSWNPQTGQKITIGTRESAFSRITRQYLRRRAWRYFRFLGFRDPARYGRAIRAALALYRDEHLSTVESLLDSWGLIHALYHGSPVLDRANDVRVRPGASLADLKPAPFKAEVWLDCRDELLALAERAPSRTVRTWSMAWLREKYRLDGLPIARVRAFLRSQFEECQSFGAELLRSATGLEQLPIGDWLELLELENAAAIPLICELVKKHVAPARLRVEECVRLAQASAAPVAELGLSWLKEKREVSLEVIVPLGDAPAPLVREEAVGWVLERIQEPEGKPEHLRELIDARHQDVRERALAVMQKEARFRDAEALWAALPESPYDDVRMQLVAHLEERLRSAPRGTLKHVWITSLLAVHRGGKAKPRVARQIADRIIDKPGEANELLPLLGIALRSLRQPEKRAALAALVRAAEERPSLKVEVMKRLPELKILDNAATAKAST